jgi:hypothetical protein
MLDRNEEVDQTDVTQGEWTWKFEHQRSDEDLMTLIRPEKGLDFANLDNEKTNKRTVFSF